MSTMFGRRGPLTWESILESTNAIARPDLNGYLGLVVWDSSTSNIVSGEQGLEIVKFQMELEVPDAPSCNAGQEIFIFLGMQPSPRISPHSILQPVLSWGTISDNSSVSWSISNWFVKGSPGSLDVAVNTNPVNVSPGQKLKSSISLVEKSVLDGQTAFHYVSEFIGIPESRITVKMPQPLVQTGIALEVYGGTECNHLPGTKPLSFKNITLRSSQGALRPNWTINKFTSSCGFAISITEDDGSGVGDTVNMSFDLGSED